MEKVEKLYIVSGLILLLGVCAVATQAAIYDYTGEYIPDRNGRLQCNVNYVEVGEALIVVPEPFDVFALVRGE